MKSEIIGSCPCCIKKNRCATTDIFVCRNDEGDISSMYIFGDDDFDVPANNQFITEIQVSSDGKNITEIVCPKCKERVSVLVPVIKKLEAPLLRNKFNIIGFNQIVESQPEI